MSDLPHNLEAEQAILGSILIGAEVPNLESEHFFDPIHGLIFDTLKKMSEAGGIVNAIMLHTKLKAEDTLKDIGGSEYLAQLMDDACEPVSISDYANLVKELYLRRLFIAGAETLTLCAKDTQTDFTEVQELAVQVAEGGSVSLGEGDKLLDGEQMLQAIYDNYDKPSLGYRSGISDFDKAFGIFGRGKFVIMGARPAMGKSAFGITLAYALSKAGAGVGFDSMDMDLTQIQARMMSIAAYNYGTRIEYESIERKEILPTVYRQMHHYIRGDEAFNSIIFNGRRGKTLNEVIRNAKAFHSALKAKGKRLDVLFIDHLQCIDLGGKEEYQAMNQIIRKLKTLAQRLDCCIVGFSQLNRDVEKSVDKIPRMSNFRGTGAIEEEADVVLAFVRPAYYHAQEEPEEADVGKWCDWKVKLDRVKNQFNIYILKNRQGRTGKIQLEADIGINHIYSPLKQSNIMEFSR